MKKVLVVGYLNYEKHQKLVEKYPYVLFVEESPIRYSRDSAEALVTLVGMVDTVAFINDSSDRFSFEIAACMMKKYICELFTEYPIEEGEKE